MWSKLLSSWAVLACLMAATPAQGPEGITEADQVITDMLVPGVEVSVEWKRCEEQNAFYFYADKRIVLCTEILSEPIGVIRFFAAHEMAHAIIHQLDIPYTGQLERAADELAMVFLAATDRGGDLVETGAHFWEERDRALVPWAVHPHPATRAFYLMCTGREALGKSAYLCGTHLARMVRTWVVLLKLE